VGHRVAQVGTTVAFHGPASDLARSILHGTGLTLMALILALALRTLTLPASTACG
jgi:hypothetical protein